MADNPILQPGESIRQSANGRMIVVGEDGYAKRILSDAEAVNFIKLPSTLVPDVNNPTAPLGEIKQNTTKDEIAAFSRKYLAPLLKGVTQEAGAAVGGAAGLRVGGGPGATTGAVTGSSAGAAIYDYLANKISPKFLGYTDQSKKSVFDYGVEGGVDRALAAGVSAAQKRALPGAITAMEAWKRGGMKSAAGSMLPGKMDAGVVDAINAEARMNGGSGTSAPMNPDVAQLKDNRVYTFIRDLFGSGDTLEKSRVQQKDALTGQANEMLSEVAGKPVNLGTGNAELMDGSREVANAKLARTKKHENILHRIFDNEANQVTTKAQRVVPSTLPGGFGTIQQVDIKAPVTLDKSISVAAGTLNRLNSLIHEQQTAGMNASGLGLEELNRLRETAEYILSAPKDVTSGKSVMPYELVKAAKTGAYKVKELESFGNALYADFRESMKNWPDAADHIKRYTKAAALSNRKRDMLESTVGGNLRENSGNLEDALKEALTDKTTALRFLQSGGTRTQGATAFLRDAFHGGMDGQNSWKPAQIRQKLLEKKEVWDTFTTAEQRTNLDYLLKRMEIAEKAPEGNFRQSIRIRGINGTMILGGALLGSGFGTGTKVAAGTAVASLGFGRMLAEGILLDPTVSRTLVSLIQQPPNTPAAIAATKRLLENKSMQGLRMVLTIPTDTGKYEAHEAEVRDGKLVPVR